MIANTKRWIVLTGLALACLLPPGCGGDSATKKTGRQVMRDNGFERVMADEFVRISPPRYAGKQLPITAEITVDSDGRFDIELPPTP